MRRLLLAAVALLLPACAASENTTYGVSPGPNDAPRIHYVVCQGDRIWRVRLDSYQGGSQPGIILPIFWEIQSPGPSIEVSSSFQRRGPQQVAKPKSPAKTIDRRSPLGCKGVTSKIAVLPSILAASRRNISR